MDVSKGKSGYGFNRKRKSKVNKQDPRKPKQKLDVVSKTSQKHERNVNESKHPECAYYLEVIQAIAVDVSEEKSGYGFDRKQNSKVNKQVSRKPKQKLDVVSKTSQKHEEKRERNLNDPEGIDPECAYYLEVIRAIAMDVSEEKSGYGFDKKRNSKVNKQVPRKPKQKSSTLLDVVSKTSQKHDEEHERNLNEFNDPEGAYYLEVIRAIAMDVSKEKSGYGFDKKRNSKVNKQVPRKPKQKSSTLLDVVSKTSQKHDEEHERNLNESNDPEGAYYLEVIRAIAMDVSKEKSGYGFDRKRNSKVNKQVPRKPKQKLDVVSTTSQKHDEEHERNLNDPEGIDPEGAYYLEVIRAIAMDVSKEKSGYGFDRKRNSKVNKQVPRKPKQKLDVVSTTSQKHDEEHDRNLNELNDPEGAYYLEVIRAIAMDVSKEKSGYGFDKKRNSKVNKQVSRKPKQ